MLRAAFRYFGGDEMQRQGGTLVRHYKDTAYMGFIPVLLHLRQIFRNMDLCKQDIVQWQPDVVILVDYPGFNLSIAEFLRKNHPNPRLLLYRSQDMGLEGTPHQEYPSRCGRALFHSAF